MRRQIPDITLARIKEKGRGGQIDISEVVLKEITVDKVSLMSSKLTPRGPIFTVLHTFSLAS